MNSRPVYCSRLYGTWFIILASLLNLFSSGGPRHCLIAFSGLFFLQKEQTSTLSSSLVKLWRLSKEGGPLLMIYESSTSYFSFLVFFLSLPVITYLRYLFCWSKVNEPWFTAVLLSKYWSFSVHIKVVKGLGIISFSTVKRLKES